MFSGGTVAEYSSSILSEYTSRSATVGRDIGESTERRGSFEALWNTSNVLHASELLVTMDFSFYARGKKQNCLMLQPSSIEGRGRNAVVGGGLSIIGIGTTRTASAVKQAN